MTALIPLKAYSTLMFYPGNVTMKPVSAYINGVKQTLTDTDEHANMLSQPIKLN